MKTAEQKTDEIMLHTFGQFSRDALREIIYKALKEQDRDTRHACAGAVLFCTVPEGASWKDVAHDACMNIKAV